MKTKKIPHISIIPAIDHSGYDAERAVTYINNHLQQQHLASTEILDPEAFKFNILSGQKPEKPSRLIKTMVRKIRSSSGILIVAPEFDGEYPSRLKNMIDFLYNEWDHKPVAISTVSDDKQQVIKSLQFSLWKINSWSLPVSFPVPENVQASRVSDSGGEASSSSSLAEESEFQEIFNNYCSKYIQLCTKVHYTV